MNDDVFEAPSLLQNRTQGESQQNTLCRLKYWYYFIVEEEQIDSNLVVSTIYRTNRRIDYNCPTLILFYSVISGF